MVVLKVHPILTLTVFTLPNLVANNKYHKWKTKTITTVTKLTFDQVSFQHQSAKTKAIQEISFDVNASHILIAVDEKATDDEVKVAEQKAITIKKDILDGKLSFGDAAKKNSDDKSAVSNRGELGFFTAFMMVYDFESAAYSLNSGEISMPVLTKYGYHLIKINNLSILLKNNWKNFLISIKRRKLILMKIFANLNQRKFWINCLIIMKMKFLC